ncbi:uncharacterized protein BDZ99DRAFT_211304, partial [Mytilinidion resinicola]
MAGIEAALAELRLNPNRKIQDVATEHGVNRSTLSKRHRGKTTSKENSYNSQQLLKPGQTRALIKYINDLSERGLPPTQAMVRNIAQEIAGKRPGGNWVSRWVKRNEKHLKSAYLNPIDKARKRA